MRRAPPTRSSIMRGEGQVPFRAASFSPRHRPWSGAATLAVFLLAWQIGSSIGAIPDLFLPSPFAVARALWRHALSGDLWTNLLASLLRLAVGWTLGTVIGISVGIAVGMFTLLRSPALALVSALFPIPKIALVPLFIIWFGIGEGSKYATLAIGVFFPTVISTYSGLDNVQRNLVTMGQSFNLSDWSIVRKIMLPGALPSVLAGFRITISVAIILLVAAEMIGADSGIGAFILAAGNLYRTDDLIAGVVILSLLGLTLSALLTRIEQAAFAWR
ncbi:MAG: ABC transporter permease [Hyphomicrobiales bacterium]|nr:ABC transporter permease [Hyphomicrobiales bacterium]MBV9138473.1 ABC transporter permease [Hyphomicrobiales bacterium]MBV9754641.1 ABC transporter permease [Hyphomicrobiales bacterium]